MGVFVAKTILEKGPLSRTHLIKLWQKKEQNNSSDMVKVITTLVVSNLLRYDKSGDLTFHSEIMRRNIIDWYEL